MADQVEKKKVLIIGGGFGGCEVARLLDSKFDVTVVERKKVFFYNVASVRAVVEPDLLKRIYLSYDNLLKNGKFIFGNVTEISPTQVVLEDGQTLTFDYLVIATGSNVISPFKLPLDMVNPNSTDTNTQPNQALQYYTNLSNKIKSAKSILIIGGGSVACELIGEITHVYGTKDKNITMVHSGSRLVHPKLNDKFNKKINEAMKKRNVNVIFNDRIAMPDELKSHLKNQTLPDLGVFENKTHVTENGKIEISADLVLWTVGIKVNNESFENHFSNGLNEKGQLKVNESLQVNGYDNIFAVGDITSVDELKTSYNAGFHAKVVANSIIQLLKGTHSSLLPKHKPTPLLLVVSLGPTDGVSQIKGMVLGGFLTKLIKSKSLFIDKINANLNSPKQLNFN